MNSHPNFLNPTLQEAICEVAFTVEEGSDHKILFEKFYLGVKDIYPHLYPLENFNNSLSSNDLNLLINLFQAGMRFKRSDRDASIALTHIRNNDYRLAVSQLPRYEGWLTLRRDLEFAWKSAIGIFNVDSLAQIAIRYINRIPRTSSQESVGDWLKTSRYMSQAILEASETLKSVFFIDEVQTGITQVAVSLITKGQRETIEDNGAILLDLLRAERLQGTIPFDSLLQKADSLHDEIWHSFAQMHTEKLLKLLKGDLI